MPGNRLVGLCVILCCVMAAPPTWAQGPLDPDLGLVRSRYYDFDSERNATRIPDSFHAISSETRNLRIAQQHGLGYLPLMIARQNQLIEKYARAAGLTELRVSWSRYTSGEDQTNALVGGFLDVAAGGIVPLLKIWDDTRGAENVRGLAAMSAMPLYLVERGRAKDLADLPDDSVIALPAVRNSNQAVILQMAAAERFGMKSFDRLDARTRAMGHPAASRALLKDEAGIKAHFSSPPFQYRELAEPGLHRLFSSYDYTGGPATFTALWLRSDFHDRNPRTLKALLQALAEANRIIREDPAAAAETYLLQSNSAGDPAEIEAVLRNPEIQFGLTPAKTMRFADFMQRTGTIASKPLEWQDAFFPDLLLLLTAVPKP